MLKQTEFCREITVNSQIYTREKIDVALQKLKVLKDRISELRAHCEELQRLRIEDEIRSILRCDECGDPIEPGQEVEAKNFGAEAQHYHKECFRKLWMR